jgi:hypothetical protein
VGRRLREALRTLAAAWHPVSSGSKESAGTSRTAPSPSTGISGTRVVDARTAHASETPVRFSDQPK